VAVTGTGWATTTAVDAAIEVLPQVERPVAPRTRLRVHLGTAEVMARAVQGPTIVPGERGVVRLLLEQPLVARGGDRFVLRSFSPVTTIGGGVVLDPLPPRAGPGLRGRRLDARQTPPERLVSWAGEAGLGGLRVDGMAVRLGVFSGGVAEVIAAAGGALALVGDHVVAHEALSAATARLTELLRAYHAAHPLDAGMSVQAMRAALEAPGQTGVAAAIIDEVVAAGSAAGVWEVAGGVARLAGWRPAARGEASAATARLRDRLAQAEWQIPTIAELEREFPGDPVRAVLAHLVREGGAEQVDRERTGAREALERFRTRLEAVLQEVGTATPAVLRDRLGLTRKFLIPLLEWADRQGITRRVGDGRVLARLTARSHDS
jgi:selenocysteine-specific elongation factor